MKRVSLFCFLCVSAILGACSITPACAGKMAVPYTDPAYFSKVPFGARSHWLQPWRATLETVPASTFINGIGINLNVPAGSSDLVCHMLAKHGFRRARIEEGWGQSNYDDESKLNNASSFAEQLLACKKYGIRPLILLNAHQGAPCPVRFFALRLLAAAHKGDTTVTLSDVSKIVPKHSGLSNLTDYWAAEDLISSVDGNVATLTKPLPKDIAAGVDIPAATLKYRPFSAPGTPDEVATLAGWDTYVTTVARFVSATLGTTGSSDQGFDMEIWNELTFGDWFLYINKYYGAKIENYDDNAIWGNLVKDTAALATNDPADFAGVQFGDGFANTIPWPASSQEPSRIAAIDKHPYHGLSTYGEPAKDQHGTVIDALGNVDTSGFEPSYSAVFPEYFGTDLQTETVIRDCGPITSSLYGTPHGRYARPGNPCSVWITEVNLGPKEDIPDIAPDRAMWIKAKDAARYFCFYVNKGVTQVDLFAAAGGDTDLGMVKDSFLTYANQKGASYPVSDTVYTSMPLTIVGRIVAQMQAGIDPKLTTTRPLTVDSVSDTHDHFQFAGDAAPNHPNLYDRDVLAILPFQSSAKRFVIPYYVMTRDVYKDLAPEAFTVAVSGFNGNRAKITAYDPMNDRAVPVKVVAKNGLGATMLLTAVDYPYLLVVDGG